MIYECTMDEFQMSDEKEDEEHVFRVVSLLF
jgi:hypothetical protein